jgi:AraC-like DNA-binding protein
LEQVDREDRERDGYSQVVIAPCVAQLLVGIARIIGFPAEIRPGIHPLMKSVLVHIDEHFARRISLNELAAIAHMSPTAFSKAFTKLNGIGPAQYIKRKRIGQAIRLLEDTDRTVIDIAMDCGFSNISNFYKAFHSLTGHAPGEYRTRQGPNGRLDAEGETVDSGKRMTEAGTGVGSKPGLPLPRPSIE